MVCRLDGGRSSVTRCLDLGKVRGSTNYLPLLTRPIPMISGRGKIRTTWVDGPLASMWGGHYSTQESKRWSVPRVGGRASDIFVFLNGLANSAVPWLFVSRCVEGVRAT